MEGIIDQYLQQFGHLTMGHSEPVRNTKTPSPDV